MRVEMTETFIENLKAPKRGRTEIFDIQTAGLVLRVTTSGAKSWSLRYRPRDSGRLVRLTLGSHPTMNLKAARKKARAWRSAVDDGKDPAELRREKRGGGKTFAVLADRYMNEHARRHKRSHATDDRNLTKHVLPKWKNLNYASIRRADAIELLEAIVNDGKPTLANRIQSLVSKVFSFGVNASLLETNPCYHLDRRGVERVRHRVLSDDEIRLFWRSIVEPETVWRTGMGLRLALLTGARVSEIAGITRGELEHLNEPDRAAWAIPGSRTKNGRDHLVPLSPMAQGIVNGLLESIEAAELHLFPTRTRKRTGSMRGRSLTQAMGYFARRVKREVSAAAKSWSADRVTAHDLRRTLGTRLAKLKFSSEIRSRVLNHTPSGVGDVHYNKYDYEAEKRQALNAWGIALAGILDPMQNVVPLSAKREA
jgi:integrase